MSVHNGKPGTRRVTGKQRKQLQRIALQIQSILDYDTQLAGRTPPLLWLTPSQVSALTPIPNLCATIWTQKN